MEDRVSEELKPCPFCGNCPNLGQSDVSEKWVFDCGCKFSLGYPAYKTKQEAIDSWNNAWAHKQIEELRKDVRNLAHDCPEDIVLDLKEANWRAKVYREIAVKYSLMWIKESEEKPGEGAVRSDMEVEIDKEAARMLKEGK